MKIRLAISEPCHQNWDSMKILNDGKFCDQCQKQVIDLTHLSPKEIVIKYKGNDTICGRINTEQLNMTIESKKRPNLFYSKFPILFGLTSVLGSSNPAPDNSLKPQIEILEKTEWKSIKPNKELIDSITIQGKVLDEDNLVIPGTNVILKGTRIGTSTDINGRFFITIPINKLSDENYLVFSFIGFKTKEYRFYEKNKSLEINLDQDTTVLGGIEIIPYKKSNLFNKIGYFFKNMFTNKNTSN